METNEKLNKLFNGCFFLASNCLANNDLYIPANNYPNESDESYIFDRQIQNVLKNQNQLTNQNIALSPAKEYDDSANLITVEENDHNPEDNYKINRWDTSKKALHWLNRFAADKRKITMKKNPAINNFVVQNDFAKNDVLYDISCYESANCPPEDRLNYDVLAENAENLGAWFAAMPNDKK